MSACAVVRCFIESKSMEVQTSNVGFTSEVSDYLVVHTGLSLLFCICVEQDISLLPQLEPLDAPAISPSAPPAYEATSEARRPPVGVTRQVSVTARGINSECVVCMDRMVRQTCLLYENYEKNLRILGQITPIRKWNQNTKL